MLADIGAGTGASTGHHRVWSCAQLADRQGAGGENSQEHRSEQCFLHGTGLLFAGLFWRRRRGAFRLTIAYGAFAQTKITTA